MSIQPDKLVLCRTHSPRVQNESDSKRKTRFHSDLNESKKLTESYCIITSIALKCSTANEYNLYIPETVGPTFTYIDTVASFFCSMFTTLTHFVHNLVLGLLASLVAPFNEQGKNFAVTHFWRAGVDLFCFATSAVGTVAPAIAFDMFAYGLETLEDYFEEDLEKYKASLR